MKAKVIIPLLVFFILALISCQKKRDRIFYINSYHKGYKPSDAITRGIIENLPEDEFELKIAFLNSKLESSPECMSKRIDSVLSAINHFKPKIIISSDDYAIKYLIKPFFDKGDIPIVYCGVNWSADQYNLSLSNITGMLEVIPIKQEIEFIKIYYPEARKLAVLSEKSLSEQNNRLLLDTLYSNSGIESSYYFADDFITWKKMFIDANNTADFIYLPTNGSIKGWNDSEAIKFVYENTRKPIITCDDFMMPYCTIGFTKVPIEQGIYAAETAKKILNGLPPSKIPISRNVESETWYNTKLANKIGFNPDSLWLSTVKLVKE